MAVGNTVKFVYNTTKVPLRTKLIGDVSEKFPEKDKRKVEVWTFIKVVKIFFPRVRARLCLCVGLEPHAGGSGPSGRSTYTLTPRLLGLPHEPGERTGGTDASTVVLLTVTLGPGKEGGNALLTSSVSSRRKDFAHSPDPGRRNHTVPHPSTGRPRG